MYQHKVKFGRILPFVGLFFIAALGNAATPAAFTGFSDEATTSQVSLERKFDAALDASDQRAWVKKLAAEPNHIGSPHDKANAEYILEQFKAWGWDAHIETFEVLYPTPKKVSLELLGPVPYTASLFEPPVPGDETSTRTKDGLPPYLVYAADGDVTAELVYINNGMPDDYKELERYGISVKGKIVIVRYGGGWRGLKPKLAAEHGAVGTIIYSDPEGDGYGQGDTYPNGAYRPKDGVQRGSVIDLPVRPGDPLTPNIGATANAARLPLEQVETILKIPALPISYADAQPLLAALGGPAAPPKWHGGLPLTYHIGPSTAKVRLFVSSDWSRKPLYDVIAILKGSEYPDQWIVRGNHHDGWVFGAADPLSGNAALAAEAKAFGALAKSGWKPKRTLVYASWDGEEAGLLGSTEWVEAHAEELRQKAILYVNSDGNARGFLHAAGSHPLQHLVNEVASTIEDPETKVSLSTRQRANLQVEALAPGASPEVARLAKAAASGGDLPIGALGSGSDYSAFLQHLGVASLDLGFGGEGSTTGVYHSAYDTFEHYSRFGDPDFKYGVTLSKLAGHLVLRVAEAPVIPFRFSDLADTIDGYAKEVHQLVDTQREHADNVNHLREKNAFVLAADPTENRQPPPAKPVAPYLDFSPLDNALVQLKRSAATADRVLSEVAAGKTALPAAKLEKLNQLLYGNEQSLLDPSGLPGRNWFRHIIYAPGLHTGYGVKTLPGIREAIEEDRWDEANEFIHRTSTALETYSKRLEEIESLVAAAASP